MNLAFGDRFNNDIADRILQKFARKDFSDLPSVEIISSDYLSGANGAFAFANDTIYLSKEFLDTNIENPQAIANVLLEEFGHYLDSKINTEDTPGDEGEIFSLLVRGEALDPLTLSELKTEDDRATIFLNDESIVIEKAELLPKVSIAATDSSAMETNTGQTKDLGKFTISRTGSTTTALTVKYKISGTAKNGTDYQKLTGSIVIPKGLSSVNLPINVINDAKAELKETVSITLTANTGYSLGTSKTAKVVINDNEKPVISSAGIDTDAAETIPEETSNPALLKINRLGNTTNPITVNYGVGGSASNGSDYDKLSGKIIVPENANAIELPINAIDDEIYEGDETTTVTLKTGSGYVLGTNKISAIAIADNDPANLTITSPDGDENWQVASSYDITWEDNISDNVQIDLYKNGSFDRTIFSSTASDGSETWTIPNNLSPASDYSLKISSVNDSNLYDDSDSNFTVVPTPFITLTSPNNGESWQAGSKQSGGYDLHFQMFEGGGDAYFDLAVRDVTPPPPPPPSSVWENPFPNGGYTYSRGFTGPYPKHQGTDLGTGNNQPLIQAAKSGRVSFEGWYPADLHSGGYGHYIKIDHGNGFETVYAHLSEALVKKGDYVNNNTVIGKVGSTGNSTGNHLHFEVRINGSPENAENYIQF
jgi:murein DD-endopeptidase MepM/ murein hydrolase activator NlpD